MKKYSIYKTSYSLELLPYPLSGSPQPPYILSYWSFLQQMPNLQTLVLKCVFYKLDWLLIYEPL